MDSKPILALNAFDMHGAAGLAGDLQARVRRRAQSFGAASVLFYDQPLEFSSAQGCRLYDAAGVPYLDAYNNVPSVGHCHPRVVAAASRQLGRLNVHSRYLHEGVLEYAERLLKTFPAALSNITFTCTGSESNDLALRLGEVVTGARGVIVTEAAYHGNTALVTGVSPTMLKDGTLPPEVRVVPAPDWRGVECGPARERAGEIFAARVGSAIDDLEACGVGFSALLLDSIFSSDGVFPDPAGFLRAAVDRVHRAGGLFIADEVQCGFGRLGSSLWGFERHGVQPDVVTLGKPMGNGYPMGGVVTRPEILEAFCAKYGYFNTFGGSPVAAAAGLAVLEVIADEGLIEHARRVGEHLRSALMELSRRHAALGEVRGAGLYVGVDVIDPDGGDVGNGEGAGIGPPSPERARALINGLRERRVLIGAAGKFGHVLKIRPPLCFGTADADFLVDALDDVLNHAAGRR